MKNIRILTLCLLSLAFTACSTVKVQETQAAKDFSLDQYKTFTFYDSRQETDTLVGDYQQELGILKREIAEQLQARGLKQSQQADLLINIGAVVEEKVQTRQTDIREAPVYIGQRRYSWESKEVETGRYNVGTVTVHLVDREENNLVWKGVAEGVIPEDQEKLRKKIEKGVEALFEDLP